MGTPYTVADEANIDAVADADSIRVLDASSGGYAEATVAQLRAQIDGAVVITTATQLSLTAASHAGRTVKVASAVPIAVTLPAASGTGNKYTAVISVAATATGHTFKVANATDDFKSSLAIFDTSATDITCIAFAATATDDTVTLDGTTKSGVRGTKLEFIDVETGLWSVRVTGPATGSYATPFSASV